MTAHDGLPPLRDVIRRHELKAHKSLGQNFLLDLNLTEKIARAAAPLDETTVIEVGPGPGGLTRGLLTEGAKRVIAVERDTRCIAALEEISAHYPSRLEIVCGDALETDLSKFAEGRTAIVANLPYNVATPLLVGWLQSDPWPPWYDVMILMFQLEVAERIVAAPGSSSYGRLGVLAGWRSQARILFTVPPEAFTPSPKVTSAIVELIPRQKPESCTVAALEQVTRTAFGQRRKMLRASLKSLWPNPSLVLESLGIPETARPQELSVAQFAALARHLSS